MKNYLILVAFFLIFAGCEKDNGRTNSTSPSERQHLSGSSAEDEDITGLLIGTWEDPDKQYFSYRFDSDGTMTMSIGNKTLNTVTYSITNIDDDPVITLKSDDITLDYAMTVHNIDEQILKFHRNDLSSGILFKWKRKSED